MAQSQADLVNPPAPRRSVPDLPEYTPYRTVDPPPAAPPGPTLQPPAPSGLPPETSEALRKALASTEEAVAALMAAAESTPARHDLAVRYRLDALAHHLQQVGEFIASRRS